MNIPDQITITITEKHVKKAYEAQRIGEDICSTCPTAQALKEQYPGVNWKVGLTKADFGNNKEDVWLLDPSLAVQANRFTLREEFATGTYKLERKKLHHCK